MKFRNAFVLAILFLIMLMSSAAFAFAPNPNRQVSAVAVQDDGKFLLAGEFTEVAGETRNLIARFHPDGNLDDTFITPPFSPSVTSVRALAIQHDGKIVIAGTFMSIAGESRRTVARLNADGSVDETFANPSIGWSPRGQAIHLLSNGKILVGGRGTISGNGHTRVGVVLLNADGTVDPAFDADLGASTGSPYVNAIATQSDGRILLGGYFMTVAGIDRNALVRLHQDGSVDTDFNPSLGPSSVSNDVLDLVVQSDDKIVVAGRFSQIAGVGRSNLARLNSDGSIDDSFGTQPGIGTNGGAWRLALQPDGRLLVAGGFASILTDSGTVMRNHLARMNLDGSVDQDFDAHIALLGSPSNPLEWHFVALQHDGRILNGRQGNMVFGGVPRKEVARLHQNGTLDIGVPTPLPPQIVVDPESVSVTVSQGHSVFLPLTLSNTGDESLNWTIEAVARSNIDLLGGVTHYTNLASFEEAAGPIITEEFSGGSVTPNDILQCLGPFNSQTDNACFSPGDLTGGFSVGSSSGDMQIHGQSGSLLPFERVGALGSSATTTIVFSPPVDAMAARFHRDDFSGGNVAVTLFDIEDNVIDSVNLAVPLFQLQGIFRGFVSTQPIARVEVNGVAGGFVEMLGPLYFGEPPTGGDCDAELSSWLDVDPMSGSVEPGKSIEVSVSFDTNALDLGECTAELRVLSNDPDRPEVVVPITLNVVDTPQPILLVTPAQVDFGAVEAGMNSDPRIVTLSSIGDAPVAVGIIGAAEAPFARVGGNCPAAPFSLAPSESCTLELAFSPTQAGAFAQSVAIDSDSNAGLAIVNLVGQGVAVPRLTASLSIVEFGEIEVGELAPARTVTLTSAGSANVTVSNIAPALSPFARTGGNCPGTPFTLTPSQTCTLIYRFGPMEVGSFNQAVAVTSNASALSIELEGDGVLTVLPPRIEIDPNQVQVEVEVGDVASEALLIGNSGEADLEWSLRMDALFGPTGMLRALVPGTVLDTVASGEDVDFAALGRSSSGPVTWMHASALSRGDATTVSHGNVPDQIAAPNTVACGLQGQFTSGNQFLRAFTLTDFGIQTAFEVQEVRFGVEMLDVAQDITVNLYTLDGVFAYANLDLLATATVNLSPQTAQFATVPISASVPASATLVMEVRAPDMSGVGQFYPGSNSLGETAPSYIATASCHVHEPTPYASINNPQVHLLMSVTGQVAVGCALPPWLGVTPMAGTVPGGVLGEALAIVDATGLSGGLHQALLCIDSNDPDRPLVTIPVSVDVVGDRIFRHGFDPLL